MFQHAHTHTYTTTSWQQKLKTCSLRKSVGEAGGEMLEDEEMGGGNLNWKLIVVFKLELFQLERVIIWTPHRQTDKQTNLAFHYLSRTSSFSHTASLIVIIIRPNIILIKFINLMLLYFVLNSYFTSSLKT